MCETVAVITLLSYGCREWPSIYLPAPFKVFSSTGFVLHISNKDMFYTPSLYARSGRWKMKYDCGMMNSVFSLHTKQMILMWLNNVKQCQTMLKTQKTHVFANHSTSLHVDDAMCQGVGTST